MAFTYDVIMATTFSENPNTIFDSSNPIPMELDEACVLYPFSLSLQGGAGHFGIVVLMFG